MGQLQNCHSEFNVFNQKTLYDIYEKRTKNIDAALDICWSTARVARRSAPAPSASSPAAPRTRRPSPRIVPVISSHYFSGNFVDYSLGGFGLLLGVAGKRVVKPTKFTKNMDADKELTKFINQCNEIEAANLASKEAGDLNIVKADGDQSKSKK